MSVATLGVLYLAGLASFLSPCVLPLLPSYLAVLAGAGLQGRPWRAGLGFSIGLSLVFVTLGFGASTLALGLSAHRQGLEVAAGALMLIFGAKLLGWLPTSPLDREARPLLSRVPAPGGFWGGLVFGAAFSLGWTPCVGPVLGAALSYAASRATSPGHAAAQLTAYALGLSTPLVAATLMAERALAAARRFRRWMSWSQRVVGAALLGLGLLLASDHARLLGGRWLTRPIGGLEATAIDCASSGASACAVAEMPDDTDAVGDPGIPVGRPHLLEFVSGHCTVCGRMAPLVQELERRCTQGDGSLLRVSLESSRGRALARHFGVHALPTFLQLDLEGREVDRAMGEQTREQLASALGSVRGEACQPLPATSDG